MTAQEPTRMINVRALRAAVRAHDAAIREFEEGPTTERALRVAAAADALRVVR